MSGDKMNQIFEKFKKLKSLIILLEDSIFIDRDKYERPFQSYGNVMISGLNNLVEFNRIVDDIWLKTDDLYLQFAREKVLKQILLVIGKEEDIKLTDINSFLTYFKKFELKEYRIYKSIKGAELSKKESVRLGSFIILDKTIHKDLIIQGSEYINDKWDKIWVHCKDDLLIGYSLKIKDLSRGYQLADLYFKKFENMIKFFVPDFKKTRELSIVDYSEYPMDDSYAINDDFFGMNSKYSVGRFIPIDLNNESFINKPTEVDYLFSIINKKNLSEIEKRILVSIDWIGNGLSEIDITKAFIQIMFAIEALLNYKNKEIIEPSILSKISEFIAFTIGKDFKERIKFEKDFKDLYKIRSNIAHGNDTYVSEGDFILLLSMTRSLIWEFVKNDELKSLNKFENYINWIKKKKYN